MFDRKIASEVGVLIDFCDYVKDILADKGYYRPDCTVWVEPTSASHSIRVNLEYYLADGEKYTNEWFYGYEAGDIDVIVHNVGIYLQELDSAALAHRKQLMSQLDTITQEMDEAGFEGARAIIAAILEPMRSNLLEHDQHVDMVATADTISSEHH
jgi:hypothetical protein